MEKVMIIGCAGAGKSTLARQLHEQRPQLPLLHLDQFYWQANWVEPPHEKWEKKLATLVKQPRWIMDGNYGRTMNLRFAQADTIIFLNYATSTCLYRVLRRTWQHLGQRRADMPEACLERFDLNFLHYVATFNWRRRRQLLQRLHNLPQQKKVFILHNDREVKQFIKQLN